MWPIPSPSSRSASRVSSTSRTRVRRRCSSRRPESGVCANGLPGGLEYRKHLGMPQQRGEPRLIEQHLLMRCLPEGSDLLFLAPGGKSLLLDGQGNKRFEMLDFGIREACFPFPHRFWGDVQVLGQSRLRQPDGDAQGQHGLPKGVVALAVRGSFHERFPSVCPPKPQLWEGMRGGNATWNATSCPVTSHTLTSILHTETIISPKAQGR